MCMKAIFLIGWFFQLVCSIQKKLTFNESITKKIIIRIIRIDGKIFVY